MFSNMMLRTEEIKRVYTAIDYLTVAICPNNGWHNEGGVAVWDSP
jgi:hypothetical protein